LPGAAIHDRMVKSMGEGMSGTPERTVPSASQEWRQNWLLVAAAMAGLTVGALPTATLGLFMQPLSDEFGWSRTQVSMGLTIFALVSLPLTPFAGMLVDRFGPRRVAVPGLVVSGACFAAFSLMSGAYYQWIGLWIAYTLASLATRSLVFSNAISRAFSTSRGLALAVLLSGTAISTALGPTVARLLITEWGWRGGYIGLGVGWAGLAAVLAFLFFSDGRPPAAAPSGTAQAAAPTQVPGGLTLREAVRNPVMLRIALAMFIQATMGSAILVHIVPMLMADGLTLTDATTLAAIVGIGSIAGKLITGALIDRIAGSILPMIGYGGPGIAYLLLLQGKGQFWPLALAVLVLGYCSGASLQVGVYLTTRYVGLRNFGAIFGVISSLMALGAGIGPTLAGWIFDTAENYTPLLRAGVPAAIVAGLAVFRLGPYPRFEPVTLPAPAAETPAISR
jgi:MFS family permease